MKLSALKNHLTTVKELNFVQANGIAIPKHFHITEAGLVTKHFIDCGGTLRNEETISFQIWVANDLNHRLEPKKLLKIIAIYEQKFSNDDLDIEIEYQSETVGKYGIDFKDGNFVLTTKQTDCLAKENCGEPKQKLQLTEVESSESGCCTPGGSCC